MAKTYSVIWLKGNGEKKAIFRGSYFKAQKHAEAAKRDGLRCYVTSKQK